MNNSQIVHTVPTVTPSAGGPSYSVPRLCQELASNGMRVSLMVLEDPSNREDLAFAKSFRYGVGPKRLGRSPEMFRALAKLAARGQISLVHTHSLWMMPNVYPGWVAKKFEVPLVVSPRGTLTAYSFASGSRVKRLFWPLVQKPALAATTCFHATCEAEYVDIRRAGFRQPVAVIPNGIDEWPDDLNAESRMVLDDENSERTVLYLGRIHPDKGIEQLLKAWMLVEEVHRNWVLRIVGPGEAAYVRSIAGLVKRLGVRNVRLAGPLYGNEKLRAYEECDLYVLFSMGENFAITVAEALMAGRPVLCTKGAPWSGLSRNHAGWWVETDIEAFAKMLKLALSLPRGVLREMGQRGRKWMKQEYSWGKVGRDMADLYKWIQKGGDMPPFVFTD